MSLIFELQNGTIERLSGAVFNASDGSLDPYVHEESLVGWPESKVFWAKETGPSVGVAPFLYFPLVDLRQLSLPITPPDSRRIAAETPGEQILEIVEALSNISDGVRVGLFGNTLPIL